MWKYVVVLDWKFPFRSGIKSEPETISWHRDEFKSLEEEIKVEKNLRSYYPFLFHYFCDGMGGIFYSSYLTILRPTCFLFKTCDTKMQIYAAPIAASICADFG